MSAAAFILICVAALAVSAASAITLLFFPLRRLNPYRVGAAVGEETAGAPPYSIEETGGVPWLSINGMPYPGSFAEDDRPRFPLNGLWLVREDADDRGIAEGWFKTNSEAAEGAEWETIVVPSTYNPADGDRTDYLGALWYRRSFSAADAGASDSDPGGAAGKEAAAPDGAPRSTKGKIPEPPIGAGRLRLCFEGILLRGEVWLNGARLGSFEGGYTPVYFDVTGRIAEENVLAVRCDNRLTLDSLPPHLLEGHNPGWHTYAGVYRPVFIEHLPETSVVKTQIRTRFDGKGGTLTAEVLGWSAEAGVAPDARADGTPAGRASRNDPPVLRLTLRNPDGRVVGEYGPDSSAVFGPGGTLAWKAEFRLDGIRRWSLEDRALYELTVELSRGRTADRVVLRPGLREFVVEGDRLLLNGAPLFLKGICRHEDHPVHGASQPPELVRGDLRLITGMGANYVRLAHYPHCREELDAAAEAGILLSEEIPLYQAGMGFTAWFQEKRPLREFPAATFGLRQIARRGLLANARRQLVEMIERDRHCPALLFWSLANECYTLGRRAGRVYSWLRETVRRFDVERPVTVVEATYAKFGLDRFRRGWDAADIPSVNSYYGWYFGNIEQVPGYLDGLRRRWPGRPFVLSEFGAGAAPGRSDADGDWRGERIGKNRTYSEEYQERVLRAYWSAAKNRPWVAGYSPWVFADFYNIWFPGNPVPNYNLKGVVSRNREPKKAWYALRDMFRETRR